MSREFSVVIERDEEGYFVASVPSLPGCHTQARSLDERVGQWRHRELVAFDLSRDPDRRSREPLRCIDDDLSEKRICGLKHLTNCLNKG